MPVSERTSSAGLNLIIYPSNLVGASRVGKVAKSLQESGEFSETHAVGMLEPDEVLPIVEQLSPGVKAVRISAKSFRGRGGWVLGQLLWPRRVVREYRDQRVAAVSAQRVRALRLAYRLSQKTGALLCYNAHELETEVLGLAGFRQLIARFLERRYIRHASVVSVVNEAIADWYVAKYPDMPRPVVLTNTPVDDGNSINLRDKFGVPDDALLYIHIGYISEGRNVALILRAFAQTPNAHVVFLGDGGLRSQVERAAKTSSNIHWHPMVHPDTVVAYARGADVGLCLIEPVSLSDRLSTPNKLMETLAAGIPPLCAELAEARRRLGPELAKTWIIDSPSEQLAGALARITAADVANFKRQWQGMPDWNTQAVELVEAYRSALRARQ